MQRWREEIHMREADFDRLHRANTRMSMAWTEIAAADVTDSLPHDVHDTRARMALAYKMSAYYEARAAECQNLFTKAKTSDLAQQTNISAPL